MAGYTDSAYRELCRGFGADITISELISADSIYHSAKKWEVENGKIVDDKTKNQISSKILNFEKSERPFVIQLFGKYPEKFAYAAKWVEENLKPDGIDINMGCPARKVVGSDHGAALLKDHKLAIEIVSAVKDNVSIPLSVKTRLGWDDDDEILDFAPKLVKTGVDALIIHGRTYKDGFKNKARWKNIYKIKMLMKLKGKSCSIIRNGDIESYDDAIKKAKNLDGVAIGRKSFGNPMIFSKKQDIGSKLPILKKVIIKHAELVYERKGDHGIIEFRKHLAVYLRGLDNAKVLRKEAVKIETVEDVENILKQINEISNYSNF